MKNNRRRLGIWGEQKAKDYLLKNRYKLVAQNWSNRYGEIDLVMLDGEILVFVEVRTKTNHLYGSGFESINKRKQMQLLKMANMFIADDQWANVPIRFDAISIDYSNDSDFTISHLINIF